MSVNTTTKLAALVRGLTWNGNNLTITGGTVTGSAPVIDMSQTWNAGAVAFTGLKANITDTASAATSKLVDLQVGGVSKFAVSKDGSVGAGAIPASEWASGTMIQATSSSYGVVSASSTRADANSVRIGAFAFDWQTNTAAYRTRALIEAQSKGATANKRGADLLFYTANDNAAAPIVRASIGDEGLKLIAGNNTGYVVDNTLSYRLDNNALYLNGNSGGVGGLVLQCDGVGHQSIVVGNDSSHAISFYTSNANKATIDGGGNLLVGVASADGLLSNTANIVGGIFSTMSGTASIPNGGATITLTGLQPGGTYLVSWELGEAAGCGVWISGGSNLGPQQQAISSGNYYTGTLQVSFTASGFGYSPTTANQCVFTCSNSTGSAATLSYTLMRLR
jgi:hypothetical protein